MDNKVNTATFEDVLRARIVLQLDLIGDHELPISFGTVRGLQSLDRAKSATIEELQRAIAGKPGTREALDLDRMRAAAAFVDERAGDHVAVCPHCHGTGQEPGVPAPHICSRCPGSGVVYVA